MDQKENRLKDEPRINIFNEDIDSWSKEEHTEDKNTYVHRHRHEHRGGSIWGLIILFIGVFILLNNLRVIPENIWMFIFPFWPIILVLIGIRMIIGKGKIASWSIFILTLILLCIIFVNAWQQSNYETSPGIYPMVGHFNSFYYRQTIW